MSVRRRESKTAKNGYTWQVYFYYEDKYGLKKQFNKSGFNTRKEAELFEIGKKQELEESIYLKSNKYLLNDVASLYFINDPHTRDSTKAIRKAYYDKHINDCIGKIDITLIDYELLQNFFNELSTKYKKATCDNIYKTINGIMRFAYNNNFIKRIPYKMIKVNGQAPKKREQILTMDQFKSIENYYKQSRYRHKIVTNDSYVIFLNLGLYLGLRIGEAIALERTDINFNMNTVSIDKQYMYGKGIVPYTKSDSSTATIPLPFELKELLITHFKKYPDTNLVVFNDEYNYLNIKTAQQNFAKLKNRINIDFHYHMLRHTFITQLWKKKIDIKKAQLLARHRNYQTTMDIYTNLDHSNLSGVTDNLYS